MADAQVLTTEQIQSMLAAQQAASASSSSIPAAAPTSNNPNRLKTSYTKTRSLEPFYTGGATAFTPDGRLLFSTLNEQVCVVRVSTGSVLAKIEGDTEQVTALAVSPDSRLLVVASRSLALRFYSIDVDTVNQDEVVRLVRTIPKTHLSQVNLMGVDPTSTLLATAGSDGVAKVWDLQGGFCTHAFKGHAGVVSALCWNMPSQNTSASTKVTRRSIELLTGSVDGKVRIWDLNSPSAAQGQTKASSTLEGHDSVVRGISVTLDGMTLVTASRDRTVVIWTIDSGKSRKWKQTDTLSAEEGIESIGFLPPTLHSQTNGAAGKRDGHQSVFWTGGSHGTLRLWDAASGSIIALEPKTYSERVAAQAQLQRQQQRRDSTQEDDDEEETRAITAVHLLQVLSEDNIDNVDEPHSVRNVLASVHADQNIILRSVDTATASSTKTAPPLTKIKQLIGFNDEIVDVTLLSSADPTAEPTETHLAVATNSRSIRIYDLAEFSSAPSGETNVELIMGHTDIVLCLDRSTDMRLLASGAKDRTARIWAWMPTWRLSSAGTEDDADSVGTKVSRNQGTLVDHSKAGPNGEWVCVAVCEGHAESVGAIAFARRSASPGVPGAPFIVTASQDRTVKIWDLAPVTALLGADSTSLIRGPIKLKSLVTQRVHEKDINCLDVSPNNAMLASGSQDRTCKLFSLSFTPTPASKSKSSTSSASAKMTAVATLRGHKRGVWACKFSPVDLALATASGDKSVRLWSLKDHTTVKVFEGHTNSVLKLSFLTTGMQLLTCAADGLVKLWNVRDEECAATLDAHEEKIWSIAPSRTESWFVSAAADGCIAFWNDHSDELAAQLQQEKVEDVQREQDFSNFLTQKDWKNAISLALSMAQPRRLLGLFTHVAQSRPEVVPARKRSTALKTRRSNGMRSNFVDNSADEESSDDDDDDDDDIMMLEVGDSSDKALARAGISNTSSLTRKSNREQVTSASTVNGAGTPATGHSNLGHNEDSGSITGLRAVDEVLATLPSTQLIQLLSYVRDWNTVSRTAPVAQRVLHAVLRHYSAQHLIDTFEQHATQLRQDRLQQIADLESGVLPAPNVNQKHKNKGTINSLAPKQDLASLLDGLLAYTTRHFDRADRTLIESSMLEYTVEAMDTLLGFQLEDDEDGEAAAHEPTFADQLGSAAPDSDDDGDTDDNDDDDDVNMSDTSL